MDINELKKELNSYKGILSSDLIEYLKSLLYLENSVISSKYLTDDKRKQLNKLEIYNKIKIFNIYYKTLKTLNDNDINYYKIAKDMDNFKIYAVNDPSKFIIFNADLTRVKGQIDLYEYFYDRRERIKERDRVIEKLEELQNIANPYSKNSLGGIDWNTKKIAKMFYLENLLDHLNNFEITDNTIYKMKLSNYITKLFLEEYNLTYKDFNILLPKTDNDYLVKTLQLKKEDMNINRNIKYM